MGQVCSVCPHAQRKAIDKALVLREPTRAIARRYGPSKDALSRHRSCIADQLERTADKSALTARSVILDLVTDLRDMAGECRNGVKDDFLRTADRLTRATEVFGKLTGEISSNQVTNLLVAVGVRDESELRSRLELTRGSESATPTDLAAECLETLAFCAREVAGFKQDAQAVLDRLSGAEVIETNGSANGHG